MRNKTQTSLKKNKKPGKSMEKPITDAHRQAEEDIEKDPDLSMIPAKEDDLDEGELARLEGED
jgi:hypothetical protein